MNLDSILKSVKSIPPLSNTTLLIQQLYSGGADNIDISKLVKVIESDAALTVNILKMVNAPIYGFSREINSITQAVSLFGTDKVYGLALNYSISEKLKANTRIFGMSNIEFNEMCHLQSSLMLQWCSTIDTKIARFLAPLALIMESGKLVLSNEIMKNTFAKKYRRLFQECEIIEECEHELVGTTSYYISGILFEYWNLNPVYVDILKGLDFEEHSKKEVQKYIHLLDVIRVAVNLKEVLSNDSIYQAAGLVQDFGFDDKEFMKIASKVKDQYENAKKQRD